ncbi:hypothetical protein EVAR_46792_1 [Eumeta japonica]|uniref:Uncharacterized protein n=1 Tax=Eumeta variegata TaxID=151549 RepID=A0A4C1XB81_EUMVA|nr:hypothetical protein EVAR_46792_1 [Eumeta japonica]
MRQVIAASLSANRQASTSFQAFSMLRAPLRLRNINVRNAPRPSEKAVPQQRYLNYDAHMRLLMCPTLATDTKTIETIKKI